MFFNNSVLCFPLIWAVGKQEGCLACSKSCCSNSQKFTFVVSGLTGINSINTGLLIKNQVNSGGSCSSCSSSYSFGFCLTSHFFSISSTVQLVSMVGFSYIKVCLCHNVAHGPVPFNLCTQSSYYKFLF